MLNKFSVAFSYYFKNYYRSKSFYLMLALIIIISGIMSYFSFRYQSKVNTFLDRFDSTAITTGLKSRALDYIWSFVLVDIPVYAAVFFGSPSISSEIEDRTAFHIFSLPVGRMTILSAKYAAAYAATVLISLIYIILEAIITIRIYGTIDMNSYLLSLVLTLIFIASVLAFTFFISSIFNRNIYAYITVLIIYFLVFNAVDVITSLLYSTTSPFLLNNAANIIMEVFIDINLFTFSPTISLSPAGVSKILLAVAVMVIYLVASLAAATVLFENKEAK
ncbi:ABC transporter permease [Thermoplasma sp. Kam2015]|uniref:ABC transporter permease n=1 Tax=Thermoplasma sp. Kam2015 TaxID=2094122 RepID=UPI000D9A26CB|nr:ABC transporter permease [Thermoplasma sp. Kam2015]PYB68187.1 ABC transporter permease [Thermoplasma sp. Kam2015]